MFYISFLDVVVFPSSHSLSMIWKMLHMYAPIVTVWLDNTKESEFFLNFQANFFFSEKNKR